ncbi:MAG: GEVED domain-containing protein, partial [Wenzhouxiangellaceae bacterium]
MLKPRRMLRHLPGAMLALLLPIHVFAELKGTNATFYSWDNNPSSRAFKNSNSSIILDGKWHPFFATLNFDSVAVNPAAASQSNGAVRCSTTDTDGNGLVGNSTPWAGTLQLSVDHIDTGSAPTINGFQSTRCWELAVCDRETNGTGQFSNADLATRPRYRRFAIDVTGLGSCPTPTQNASFGYVNPLTTNGFITLLSRDVVNPCSQAGRCNSKIDTNLYIILDRDCDGFIDDNDGAQVNNDPARGNLGLIGTGGAGRIPLPVGNNDPQVCFYAEGKKPDFTRAPQWTGNVQARITAPAGSSGDKTVNHSIIASPAAGDVGDLPAAFPAAVHVTNAFADPNPFLGASTDNDPAQYSSLLADGDDTTGNASSDEDGVVLPTDSTADGDGSAIVYTATATATNNSGVPAQLCGWFDMNQDQVLNNSANTSTTASDPTFASRTDDGERSCIQIPTGTTNGSFPVAWTIPASARENTGNFFLRFRISRDRDMFDSFVISASDGLNSGEVEDYLLEGVSTLPVSISSFLARATKDGLEVEWT